ncbi:hypothetical protein HMPREF1870_00397 [Bacteroidales bacterium KA00344]|nr:hypothetical protein HMPREF1870_00397 [Bacteroidales bacterium KA00344]
MCCSKDFFSVLQEIQDSKKQVCEEEIVCKISDKDLRIFRV